MFEVSTPVVRTVIKLVPSSCIPDYLPGCVSNLVPKLQPAPPVRNEDSNNKTIKHVERRRSTEIMEDFLHKALYLDEVGDEDIDTSAAPTSGEEYLKRVILEARKCQEVVVANIDVAKLKKQTVQYSDASGCDPAPQGFAPSHQWQQYQVAEFSALRQKLAKFATEMSEADSAHSPPVKFPKLENEAGWCKLCLGKTFQERLNQAENLELTTFETPEDEGTPPLMSIILNMNQYTVETLLEYHTQWFELVGFSQAQGRWLYALLAVLEKPLTPETCSVIRNIARLSAKIRAKLESKEDPLLPQLNLLICLVGRYFGQTDVADSLNDN